MSKSEKGITVRVSQLGSGPPEVELKDAQTGEHVHWDQHRTAALRRFCAWVWISCTWTQREVIKAKMTALGLWVDP